jgi:hypothetical protein
MTRSVLVSLPFVSHSPSSRQESHLWTSTGLMVGTFGATAWEVQMKATWKMKPNDNSSAAQELNKVVQNAVPPPPHRLETLLPFPLDLILLTVPRNQN